MQTGDRPEFLRILTGLAAIKPGKTLTPEGLDLYWQAMQGWSIADFREAAGHLARAVEFMPSPFHFEQLRRSVGVTTAEAWARAVKHAATSAYRRGPLGDPAIDLAVRALGGYRAIAMTEEPNLHFLERRFVEHFEAQQDAETVRAALPQLTARIGPARLRVDARALPHAATEPASTAGEPTKENDR